MIKIRLLGQYRSIADKGNFEFSFQSQKNPNLEDLLNRLTEGYPEIEEKLYDSNKNLRSEVSIMINGRNISYLQGLDTPLENGDRIVIFPPVGGG